MVKNTGLANSLTCETHSHSPATEELFRACFVQALNYNYALFYYNANTTPLGFCKAICNLFSVFQTVGCLLNH